MLTTRPPKPLEIHKLIISIWNKEELREELKESIKVPVYEKDDKTFLSLDFRRVMKLVCFLLGISPASD
jgi:hypothetical protein